MKGLITFIFRKDKKNTPSEEDSLEQVKERLSSCEREVQFLELEAKSFKSSQLRNNKVEDAS